MSATESTNEKIIGKPYFGNSKGAIVISLPKKFATQCNIDTKSSVVYNDKTPQPLEFRPLGAIFYDRAKKYFNSSLR